MNVQYRREAGKFNFPDAGVYAAQMLRKPGSDVNAVCLYTPRLLRSGGSASTSSGTGDKKNPHWLRSSSQCIIMAGYVSALCS